jgi:hypothetical protein
MKNVNGKKLYVCKTISVNALNTLISLGYIVVLK